MILAQATVEQVKAYPDIVTIISDYISLKKKGRNYLGLCPFHSEKTPSFTVSPEKRIWHCFGCHESGDHIGFMMKVDNLSFAEAIVHIAQKAGITVVYDETPASQAARFDQDVLREILSIAKDYFVSFLKPATKEYLYLKGRGLADKTIQDFQLGLASAGSNILDHLLSRGFSKDQIQRSGLVYQSDQGVLVSRFRNRIMFPILDYRGRTVGFSGRFMGEAAAGVAKYVNSEESSLFSKRKLLYGLYKSKNAIQKEGFVILMEGFMDVMMAYQYGFENVVATMGTAVTAEHAQKLKRFTDKVTVAMDGDEAGQKSIERSYDLLRQLGFNVFVLQFDNQDPADVLLSQGPEYFSSLLAEPLHMAEFKLNRLLAAAPITRIEQAAGVLDQLIPILRAEKDGVIQNYYIKKIAGALNINIELIVAKLKKNKYITNNALFIPIKNKKDKYLKAVEHLTYLAASSLELRTLILEKLQPQDFLQNEYVQIMEALSKVSVLNQDLLPIFEGSEQKRILSELLVRGEQGLYPLPTGNKDWVELVKTLKSNKRQLKIAAIKQKIAELENNQSDQDIQPLLAELSSLILNDNEED